MTTRAKRTKKSGWDYLYAKDCTACGRAFSPELRAGVFHSARRQDYATECPACIAKAKESSHV